MEVPIINETNDYILRIRLILLNRYKILENAFIYKQSKNEFLKKNYYEQ